MDDFVRFCTNADEVCVLGFDPTFNLGPFDVTVTMYRHVAAKEELTSWASSHDWSTPVSRCPDLANLCCFGTDGEAALVNALSTVYISTCYSSKMFSSFSGQY